MFDHLTHMSQMDEKAKLNRLRWRSRRGMLELDLLLLPFFDEMYQSLSITQQQAFERLLAQDDPDLLLWFNRQDSPDDAELASLVAEILLRSQSCY